MPYIVTNPSSLTRACVKSGLKFPRGKTPITDEQFSKLKASKPLSAMVREGLLKVDQMPSREPKSRATGRESGSTAPESGAGSGPGGAENGDSGADAAPGTAKED